MTRHLMLTDEELATVPWVSELSSSEKIELSLLVYELSIALYNLNSVDDE